MRAKPPGAKGLSRRTFLQAAAGTALLLGVRPDGSVAAADTPEAGRFSAFLRIEPDGAIHITTPATEMGQGVHNSLPRILAEELDADWARVVVQMPTADRGLAGAISGRQRTANSDSVIVYYEQLRTLGATAREMLVLAAAERWSVPPAECVTAASEVRHSGSGRKATYGSLAAEASRQAPPQKPRRKDPADFRLIGKSLPRKDLQPKVDGKAVFGIDVALPGLLHGALRMPGQIGGTVVRFDPSSVLERRGVVAVVPVEGGIAVLADSFWRARQAAEALDVEFGPGPIAGLGTDEMRERLRASLTADDAAALPFPDVDTQTKPMAFRPLDREAARKALADAQDTLDLVYEVPYLSHLAMEPLVCTVLVTADSCRIWAPHQHPDTAREVAARITKLPLEKVRLDITFAGGGFGRKWELDFLRQTVEAAAAVPGRPVKLCWTREQDVAHDYYRPGFMARTQVALGSGGIQGMYSRIAGQSIWRFQGKPMLPGMGDPTVAALLVYDVYDFPGKYIDFVEAPWKIPVGLWRSVTLSQNAFFAESAIDEAAVALGRDPYEFRRELLHRHPRLRTVLETAARRAGWGTPLPPGHGRGIALSHGFESICVQVAEVAVEGDQLQIRKLVCAFDCGLQIDPDTIRAQLEGAMIFGLSAALRGEVTFKDGGAVESNFHDQPILRLPETPEIIIELIVGGTEPGGVGEAGVPAVAPALANAIFAASKRRIRRLPLSRGGLTLA